MDMMCVCEACRLIVVEYFHQTIGLAEHPFLDQFMNVDQPRAIVRVKK